MPVNAISPSQPIQALNKNDVVAARKQAETQEADKARSLKEAADKNAQLDRAQLQKTQETKPAVNSEGQKVGTLINISA